MIILTTGQVGVDKKPYLEKVCSIAREKGHCVDIHNIGDLMYDEAPDVAPGKILDLPLSRLDNLRRSVFKDVLNDCADKRSSKRSHAIINTHATFRWRHGLFYAFDYDQMKKLDPDIFVSVIDGFASVHRRLKNDGFDEHSLTHLMVWREEEILATELLSRIISGHGRFYVVARGHEDATADSLARLFCCSEQKKAYLSFPISHVLESPERMREIGAFRDRMKNHFICFDPMDLEEKAVSEQAIKAAQKGHRTITVDAGGEETSLETSQVIDIIPDIDGQIYSRDFMLIDQADMIISLVPQNENRMPVLSSGVERELQHAHEATRDVFVIWLSPKEPSPFVTETANKVFRSIDEAEKYFKEAGYVPHAKKTKKESASV